VLSPFLAFDSVLIGFMEALIRCPPSGGRRIAASTEGLWGNGAAV